MRYIEPVFWLMHFGCIKMQRQRTGLCRLKGLKSANLLLSPIDLTSFNAHP